MLVLLELSAMHREYLEVERLLVAMVSPLECLAEPLAVEVAYQVEVQASWELEMVAYLASMEQMVQGLEVLLAPVEATVMEVVVHY